MTHHHGQSRQTGRLSRHIERAAAVVRAMPAYRARANRRVAGVSCNHEWLYGGTGDFTGYIEKCPKCGEIRQIVQ